MLKLSFEINGRQVTPANIGDALEAAILEQLERTIHSKLAGIRDPETGEFPTVAVRGGSLKNLSFVVNGSPAVVELVKQRLGQSFESADAVGDSTMTEETDAKRQAPVAFLCHASENKELAERIAKDFQRRGIDTFFDRWEIGPGDSIRMKIDTGLENCTHFVVLLTPESVGKPWVNAEIDAAFVAKVESRCKFIPLRSELPIERLSPLLRSMHAPALENYEKDIGEVIDWIHGVSRKPPLGPPPQTISQTSGKLGLSPAAEAIVRLFVERSQHGGKFDPQLGANEIRKATELGDDDIVDAVDELEARGLVGRSRTLSDDPIGLTMLYPEAALFTEFDQYFKDWNPSEDARLVAAELVNGQGTADVSQLAGKLNWLPRRMNPAVEFLFERRLVDSSRLLGTHPWSLMFIRKNAATRRFVRDR